MRSTFISSAESTFVAGTKTEFSGCSGASLAVGCAAAFGSAVGACAACAAAASGDLCVCPWGNVLGGL
ncbi:hypothetical protein [Saliniramus sp.]|uniref:hypothetical protein n=1 Tax=Saliniramus sp. TaxID=2986772 RepID=UPI002C0CB8DE|nr:hypothetical protein [Saliniramus sp.]HMB11178.1 hypothetical protein [Saliniramus sp.]